MARNTARDYKELPKFAQGYIGKPTLQCIEDYAAKRKIVSWGTEDSSKLPALRAKAQFLIFAAMHYNNRQ